MLPVMASLSHKKPSIFNVAAIIFNYSLNMTPESIFNRDLPGYLNPIFLVGSHVGIDLMRSCWPPASK